MAGHFPFAGKRGTRYGQAPRGTIAAFFENHGFGEELQEKYYKWWYDFAKDFVEKDSDLSVTMITRFNSYPMGTHAEHSFHLNDKYWAECLAELGSFIRDVIFPKMDEKAMHDLEEKHSKMLADLEKEAEEKPREPAPEVGVYRHV
ncbi:MULTISPECIES: hypothetical protein [unclassified Thioalkalivibrio]|uniref:hypothetical protein n=1 Tax=unclassified Thioalkalivibrio TaxID=2621013 RepID=UPI00037A3192|nr:MULTISPECIES: hypothetical protein [unclassified Thioalkalivibrio]